MNEPMRSTPGQPASGTGVQPWRRAHALLPALVLACVLALLGGCAALDTKQREWIFQPSDRTWSGGLSAAQGMEDVWIEYRPRGRSDSVRLHGLWIEAAQPDAPVLLHLHGSRWDVRGSAHRARRLKELGFAVLSVDYRGFGRSTAELPSEDSAHEDAQAAWQWLGEQHPGRARFLFGHSLGSAIAVRLAAGRDDVAGLLLEGSFPSIPDVVSTMAWGWLPLGPLITQRFDAGSRIAEVKAPVLLAHGSEDRVIRPELGQALFAKARAPKRFLLVDGGTHHSTMAEGMPRYRQALGELFGVGLAMGPAATGAQASAQFTGLAPSGPLSTAGGTPTR